MSDWLGEVGLQTLTASAALAILCFTHWSAWAMGQDKGHGEGFSAGVAHEEAKHKTRERQ